MNKINNIQQFRATVKSFVELFLAGQWEEQASITKALQRLHDQGIQATRGQVIGEFNRQINQLDEVRRN